MEYRRLGKAGIQVSALSFGSWVTFGPQVDEKAAQECLAFAYDKGVNFFDNAEIYSNGQSEQIMGNAIKKLAWRRGSYLISTKLFWGLHDNPNEKNTLNRKYLIEGINGSLKRLQLDYVDLVYCHRPDPYTTIEEVVWTMSDIVASGKALYWGTSEWSAADIIAALEIAEKYNLRKPVTEQPQYNLFHRQKVESEYSRLFSDYGYGTTIWSPLASGVLTGKYAKGVPSDSRANLKGYEWLKDQITDQQKIQKVENLRSTANDMGCSVSQLAIAWCLKNKNVSTVILGASKISQLEENLAALSFVEKIDAQVLQSIENIFKGDKL